MYLQLDESDRIVVEYHGPKTKSTPNGNRIVVACGAEVLDEDIYMVLWELRNQTPNNRWQLLWRGDWASAMKKFAEYVGDVDQDALIELQHGFVAKGSPDA